MGVGSGPVHVRGLNALRPVLGRSIDRSIHHETHRRRRRGGCTRAPGAFRAVGMGRGVRHGDEARRAAEGDRDDRKLPRPSEACLVWRLTPAYFELRCGRPSPPPHARRVLSGPLLEWWWSLWVDECPGCVGWGGIARCTVPKWAGRGRRQHAPMDDGFLIAAAPPKVEQQRPLLAIQNNNGCPNWNGPLDRRGGGRRKGRMVDRMGGTMSTRASLNQDEKIRERA